MRKISNIKYQISNIFWGTIGLILTAPRALAQAVNLGELGQNKQASTFRDFIGALYTWGARLGVALAIVMTVWAGYLYMTSTGNPDQINRAKEYLTGAIIGLGLIFLSYLILNTISPALVGGQ